MQKQQGLAVSGMTGEADRSTRSDRVERSNIYGSASSAATALRPEDQRVIARVRRAPTGASAIDIARASLGWRAKRHSIDSLTMIGLAIASRLCGERVIEATRSNRFVLPKTTAGEVAA